MNFTEEKYEAELKNIKRDLQRLLKEMEYVIELVDREDIELAHTRAYDYMADQAEQAVTQLQRVLELDNELQEEARERYEEARLKTGETK
jgi:hypothetical protein